MATEEETRLKKILSAVRQEVKRATIEFFDPVVWLWRRGPVVFFLTIAAMLVTIKAFDHY